MTEQEMSMPKEARQLWSDEESLYASAREAEGQMLSWLSNVAHIVPMERVHQLGPFNPKIDYDKPGMILVTTPLKSVERAREKVEADYGGDWSRLMDVVRASIAVDGVGELSGIVEALRGSGMVLARCPKDRFSKPYKVGYRDLQMNLVMPNGHIVELQVHVKPMLEVREAVHGDYEGLRSLSARLEKEGRTSLSLEELVVVKEMTGMMVRRYGQAWEKAKGGVELKKEASMRAVFAKEILARYSDEELRKLYGEMFSSRKPGLRGLLTLMDKSIFDVDKVDWPEVKRELLKYPTGQAVARGMESLPKFNEMRLKGYHKVREDMVPKWTKEPVEFSDLVRQWETFERRVLQELESEMVDYYMAEGRKELKAGDKEASMEKTAAMIRGGDICQVDLTARGLYEQDVFGRHQLKILRDVVRQGNGLVDVESIRGDMAYVSAHDNPGSKIMGGVEVPVWALTKLGNLRERGMESSPMFGAGVKAGYYERPHLEIPQYPVSKSASMNREAVAKELLEIAGLVKGR